MSILIKLLFNDDDFLFVKAPVAISTSRTIFTTGETRLFVTVSQEGKALRALGQGGLGGRRGSEGAGRQQGFRERQGQLAATGP